LFTSLIDVIKEQRGVVIISNAYSAQDWDRGARGAGGS